METWSVYITMPDSNGNQLLHPDAQKMWQHMRAGLLYFFRSEPPADAAQSAADAQAELKKYAKLAEELLPINMCTFNLHVLVCRLVEQEKGESATCMQQLLTATPTAMVMHCSACSHVPTGCADSLCDTRLQSSCDSNVNRSVCPLAAAELCRLLTVDGPSSC
jgi:hypothetical protein